MDKTLENLLKIRDTASLTLGENREYLHGNRPPQHLGINLPQELLPLWVALNWCRMVAHAYANRLRIVGFKIAGEDKQDDRLQKIWDRNRMANLSNLINLEALALGHSYASVSLKNGKAVIRPESAETITVDLDPATGEILSALRTYSEDRFAKIEGQPTHAVVYEPFLTTSYKLTNGKWVVVKRQEHGLDEPAIVQFAHRTSILDYFGTSVFVDVIPLQDAAQRTLLDLAAAVEFAALPQKAILGVDPESLKKPDGSSVTKHELRMDSILALGGDTAKIAQWTAADLNNFVAVVRTYAELASSVSAVPEEYFSVTPTANPTSADAQRASESRLIKASEVIIEQLKDPYARLQSIASRLEGRNIDAYDIEVSFADPASPTKAQTADAAVKMYQAKIISREQAQRDAGYSPADIKRMALELNDEDPLASAINLLDAAPATVEGEVVKDGADPVQA